MSTIPVFKPLLGPEEIGAAAQALELGWLGMGSYVGQFEEALRQFLGATDRHVVAVSTGHAALHLALMVAGVGPGDEVITPAFNNVADFQAILAVGAEPVFCDVEDHSLCIDLDLAERLVSPRTKALIVMDYDCLLCDHDRAARLADKHGLRIVHDAAHSLGSRHRGRMIGSFSDLATFSFDPVKAITCIDGGAVVARSAEEAEALREMRLIGMGQPTSVMYQNRRAWTYDVRRLGYRYHMANLHAAIGLAQLAKMGEIEATRRTACQRYNDRLAGLPGVRTPATDFRDVTPFLYYLRVPADERNGLRAWLSEKGIDTGLHWQPGHWFTLLRGCRRGDLTVTDSVGHEILSLPLHSRMDLATVDRVCDGVRSYFRKALAA
jgi:dTDP-4-amino-4,6-dideoxygalactose transaminase